MHNFLKKRKVLILLLGLFIFISLTTGMVLGAGRKIVIQTPPTVSALPLLWMNEEGKLGDDLELEINISPDHKRAIALIAKNEIDMMVTGVNVGAKIYNKGIDVSLMNVNIWGIDYLLTKDFKIDNWRDLKGKTLCLPLKGGPLDFLARYFLINNGIEPEEVDLVYRPLTNGARYFQAGELDAIILPEPLVTVTLAKTDDAYLSLDLQKEWAKLHNGDARIPFVGLFVAGKFARNNPELIREFNQYYLKGIDWVNDNPEEAAALGAKYFKMPVPIIKKSFQRTNLGHYPRLVSSALTEIYFNEIMKIYPEMLGGKLPDEKFYQ